MGSWWLCGRWVEGSYGRKLSGGDRLPAGGSATAPRHLTRAEKARDAGAACSVVVRPCAIVPGQSLTRSRLATT